MAADAEKIEELSAIIQTVRDRVRARYPQTQDGVSVPVADLLPIVHARDAAQAKIAAIGSVNPRAGGLVNKIIQFVKKTVARSLQWFVRDQIAFNREAVSSIEAILEALNEQNRILVSIASQTNDRFAAMRDEFALVRSERAAAVADLSRQIDARAAELSPLFGEIEELKDIRRHWIEWRPDWERKLALNEIQFLRSVADLQGAFQHRVTLIETNFRDMVKAQHTDYLGALDRSTLDVQKRLWTDMEKVRMDFERLIHSELRIIRQRGVVGAGQAVAAVQAEEPFDYTRFAERFRGPEEYVRDNQHFYKPFFAGRENVLDIGCGRGEFLESMRELNVPARGIDLGAESVAQCRDKGLNAEQADLFRFLAGQPDEEFDGIFSSQVAEHIEPERLLEMIRLCAAKLRRGGILAIETPNPQCLAIFASHFYLDPTHTRPIPSPLMSFYMEEAGLGSIQIHALSPAVDSMPEIAELPESFREKFFGGLDYAIIGTRL